MRRDRDRDTWTFLAIKVDGYEAKANIDVNINLRISYPSADCDDELVFTAATRLELVGTAISPDNRAGQRFEIRIRSKVERWPLKLNDLRVRNQRGLLVHRTRRGSQIPVYKRPPGIALIEKRRGVPVWTMWLTTEPALVHDMLTLASTGRALYLSVQERKVDGHRWAMSFGLQTTNPADE
jgi:hypothetical protein